MTGHGKANFQNDFSLKIKCAVLTCIFKITMH